MHFDCDWKIPIVNWLANFELTLTGNRNLPVSVTSHAVLSLTVNAPERIQVHGWNIHFTYHQTIILLNISKLQLISNQIQIFLDSLYIFVKYKIKYIFIIFLKYISRNIKTNFYISEYLICNGSRLFEGHQEIGRFLQ